MATHTTKKGERWDEIAYKYYGDPTKDIYLIQANPTIPAVFSLPAGLLLTIPELMEEAVAVVTVTSLPPWKI